MAPSWAPTAISLAQALGVAPRRAEAARALLDGLDRLYADFPREQAGWLARYRAGCPDGGAAHTGAFLPAGEREGTALGVEEDFSLRVAWKDGGEEVLSSGEVSVRGLLGYV